MKVKFLREIRMDYGEVKVFAMGQTYDLKKELAEDFLGAEFCILAEEKKKKTVTKKADKED